MSNNLADGDLLYSPPMFQVFGSVTLIMNIIELLSAPHRLKSAAEDSVLPLS